MSGGWAGHRGGYDTPAWRALRRQILIRDGRRCQWPEAGVRCLAPAWMVDHIRNRAAGGTDDPTNLWTLCQYHHDRKTAQEGSAARHRFTERRAPEQHPGLAR